MLTANRSWIKYIVAVLLSNLSVFLIFWILFLNTPLVTTEKGFAFTVKNGASFKSVAADLHEKRILAHPFLFNLLVFLRQDAKNLKAGEYYLPYGTTPSLLISQLSSGHGMILHTFVIIPGSTFSQIRAELESNPNVLHKIKHFSNTTIMKKLRAPELNPEGQFYADTYYFAAETSDISLLRRAYHQMQDKLNAAWLTRDINTPFLSPYQALIAASIVEKEAYLQEERPLIAGVLVNRLKKHIILQFDPTVIYGLGEHYRGSLYKQDLQDTKNLYNTYVYHGLPPSPIATPSMDSIKAVMKPDKREFYYFVATGKGGHHQFSQTLTEHNIAVLSARSYHAKPFNIGLMKKHLHKTLNMDVGLSNPNPLLPHSSD